MWKWSVWWMMSLVVGASLNGCGLNDRGSQPPVAALDKLIPAGIIYVAQAHLQALGFDPGPVDGIFREQTAAAIRQYQRRYGLVVSGLLDAATREQLLAGFELPPD